MNLTQSIRTPEQLEDLLSQPTEQVIEMFGRRDGDVILLGAAGKIGPSLARMAQRACQAAGSGRRVIAVSRFSDARVEAQLKAAGITTIPCDLLDDAALERLPDAADVIYLAGMKFGATDQLARTWAMNTHLPGMVCRKYRHSRIVAYSTGNIYGLIAADSGGSREKDTPNPVGEYAMSCLGRERILEHFSRALNIPVTIIRLNYACELRYGVIVDLAQRIMAGETIDLNMGYFNIIWQGDANAMTLLGLTHSMVPPLVLNVTGPERLSVREVCQQLGHAMDKPVNFSGVEAPSALLSNAARAFLLLGQPRVKAQELIHWIADWIKQGGTTLAKPTHFEVRDGQY